MVLVQFACPHCTEQFTLENPPPGATILCPHCGLKIGIPDVAPPPVETIAPTAAPDAAATGVPLDFLSEEPASGDRRGQFDRPRIRPTVRPLDRAARRQRQQWQSLAVMVLCLVVLAIAVVVLGRL